MAEGIQQHVCLGAQAPEDGGGPRLLQIHSQRTLASGQEAHCRGVAGSVHKHNLRPKVRQDHSAERYRGQAGQLHYADGAQRHGAPGFQLKEKLCGQDLATRADWLEERTRSLPSAPAHPGERALEASQPAFWWGQHLGSTIFI